jgi:hypothetical protein
VAFATNFACVACWQASQRTETRELPPLSRDVNDSAFGMLAYDAAVRQGKSNGEAAYASHEAAEAGRRTGGFLGVFS